MKDLKASSKNIPHFVFVAPSIWDYTPPSTCTTTPQETEAPSLIILCTWTGAQNQYIAKYTSTYQSLYPSTRIMVIATTTKDLCFRNSARKQARLAPAISRIASLAYLDERGTAASILLHVFSEGGSNKACELAEAYHATTGRRLPVSAVCLDSTPGHPRYLRLCNALNKSLPQVPVLRHTGLMFGGAVLGAFWFTYKIFKGAENNVITRTRRRIVDPTFFDLSAPRCYLYSKSDALIAWRDVEEHALEAEDLGVPVDNVLFEGSGHVGHARAEPERYWGAVVETWKKVGGEGFDEKEVRVGEKSLRWSDADSQLTLCHLDKEMQV